jgi:hypothetical protein
MIRCSYRGAASIKGILRVLFAFPVHSLCIPCAFPWITEIPERTDVMNMCINVYQMCNLVPVYLPAARVYFEIPLVFPRIPPGADIPFRVPVDICNSTVSGNVKWNVNIGIKNIGGIKEDHRT